MASFNENVKKSNILAHEDKFDEALNLIKPYINSPHLEKALFQCGKILMYAKKDNEAWIYFNELVYRDESYREEIYLWLATMKTSTDFEYAKRYFNVLINTNISNNSNKKKAMLSYGQTLFIYKQYEESYEIINKLLECHKNYEPALFLLAKLKIVFKKYDDALLILKKLSASKSMTTPASELIDMVKKEKNKINVEELTDKIEDALKFSNFNMADIYCDKYEQRDKQCAVMMRSLIKRYKKINQESEEASGTKKTLEEKTALIHLMYANLYLQIGYYEKALKLYEQLVETKSYIKEAIYGIYAIGIKTNNHKGMFKYFREYKQHFTLEERYRLLMYYNSKVSESINEINNKKVIKHIIKRHKKAFCVDIDIEALYYMIKDRFKNSNLVNARSFKYHVVFAEPIGTKDGITTNCLEVISFLEKSNIITMYPVIQSNNAVKIKEKIKKKGIN